MLLATFRVPNQLKQRGLRRHWMTDVGGPYLQVLRSLVSRRGRCRNQDLRRMAPPPPPRSGLTKSARHVNQRTLIPRLLR
jgi:hypothetical protein